MEVIDALPPKVAAAIAAVMTDVPKLEKGEKNGHGNYNFASIDDFLEAVRPLCAKAGLIIVQDEDEFEVVDQWLRLKYRFTLAHVSGETWSHRPTRSILVQAKMGAQAFGAAQSYVEKQFMRSLFQIATGDKEDADSHTQTDLPAGARGSAPVPIKRGSDKPAPTVPGIIPVGLTADDKPDWRGWGELFSAALSGCVGETEVNALVEANTAALTNLAVANKKWADALQSRIAVKRGNLSQKPAA